LAAAVFIEQIELPAPGIEQMHAEARSEGYKFLDTLVEEWTSGENRFDAPGEALCGHLHEGILVAIGGLNCDPFLGDPTVGRIRRVYVRPAWRNNGIGGALLDKLLSVARQNFSCVRLRAENPAAARLYERKGFSPGASASATHILHFDKP
jgi:GNAT superfamily N-acetyltransferase